MNHGTLFWLPVLGLSLLLSLPLAYGQAAPDTTLTAPDGTTVSIERDDWGVPLITADTESAVFFGQGFASAQDRLFQMETFWRSSTGRLAEILGSAGLAADRLARTVLYTDEERADQFDALPEQLQDMIASYAAGVNAFIALAQDQPAVYMPVEYSQPPLSIVGMEEWDERKVVAVIQFFIRRFGEAGGQELQRLAELQTQGPAWFEANRPINDPTAPTTLPSQFPPAPPPAFAYTGPAIDPAVPAGVVEWLTAAEEVYADLGIPGTLGSYAALIAPSRSAEGHSLLLGVPQMGVPAPTPPGSGARAVTWESELLVGEAGDPVLHTAGMTVPGIPGVIIGRTKDWSWTLTSGVSDNVDTFIEQTEDDTLGRYFFDGEFVDFEVIEETINVIGAAPVPFTRVRSVHGPVFASDLDNRQAFTWQYAFWNGELDMADALYQIWQATSAQQVHQALALVPVSFNFFTLDRTESIRFWHVGRYPVRPGSADPRLPLLGDGSQEWAGFVPFESLPQGRNPAQGYFANWNNKPAAWWNHGDNIPWTATTPGNPRTYDGVLDLVAFIEGGTPLAFDEMKGLHAVVDAREYPGTYQQLIMFDQGGSRAENLVPPGQSAFYNVQGQPSPHVADQHPLYLTYEMKPFTFQAEPTVSDEPGAPAGSVASLGAAYPNPLAAGVVRVPYDVPAGGAVRLEVFDVLGRSLAGLVDGEVPAGVHEAELSVSGLASGVYVVRLHAGDVQQAQRLTILR